MSKAKMKYCWRFAEQAHDKDRGPFDSREDAINDAYFICDLNGDSGFPRLDLDLPIKILIGKMSLVESIPIAKGCFWTKWREPKNYEEVIIK